MGAFMSTSEVSAETGIPTETLRYWRWLGDRGPASFKLGPRRVVYDRQEVERWVEEQRALAAATGR